MRSNHWFTPWVLAAAGVGAGCSDGTAAPAGTDAGTATAMRNGRYCEILAGSLMGTSIQFDVYSTWGLNTCPDAQWQAVTTAQAMADTGRPLIRLNGPRYWTQDAFENSQFIDPTPRTVAGISMRLAGRLTIPLAEAMDQSPYVTHTVQRNTVTVFNAGQPVYELVDPMGRVFTMQSYSVQQAMDLTVDALPGLASRLMLPTGWQYRTRTLTAPLRVTLPTGMATVVQDNLVNTYILSSG